MPRAPKAPASLSQIAEAGDRLATLRALRRTLASSVEVADPENVSSLAKQLQSVLAEIDALERAAPQEADPLDEITKRRAARMPGAADRDGAAGADEQRRPRGRRVGGVGGPAS
jgi:hypothetical protein